MPMTRAADLCVDPASSPSDGVTGRLTSAAGDHRWPFVFHRAQRLATSDIHALRRITARDRGLDWGEK